MKKHSFKLALLALVLVLSLSTVLLAACNNDDPAEEPDYSKATGTMLGEIVDKISSSMSFGESFGVDVSAAFVIDDKTTANKDVSYKLIARGNADGKQNASEENTNFVIELVKQEGETKEVLMGLAYESIEDEPFVFVNLMESGYKKINAYSMAALYKMTQKVASVSADEGGFDISNIIGSLVPILFGETGTVKDGVYTLQFDLAKTVSGIIKQKGAILLALGMTEEQLNALIEQYLGELNYEQNGQTVTVKDLTTLESFFKRGMSFKGDIVFAFNNDKFANANASFDFAYHGEDKANYTLRVDKAEIGKVATPVNSFEGFALSKDERKAAQAFNLLNFSLTGTATGLNEDGEPIHNYSIEIQSDIDAFELLGLFTNGMSKENIVATLKKLGYFHLQINEVFEDKDPSTIIMLHSKFEEGFAVANVKTYNMSYIMNKQVGIGGVYDFDALIDMIANMTAGSDEPSEPSEPSEPEEKPSIIDSVKDIMNTVKEFMGYFVLDNMQEDGVTIPKFEELIFKIVDMLGVELDSTGKSAVETVIGNKGMNVKLQTPTFGTCSQAQQIATEDLVCNIRQASSYRTGKTDFIKEITEITDFSFTALQFDTRDNWFDGYLNAGVSLQYDKAYKVKGINLKGEEIETTGFIVGSQGFDPTKSGEQEVTFFVAIANDVLDLNTTLKSLMGMDVSGIAPLFGALKYKHNINVIPFDENIVPTVTNLKTGDQKVLVNGSNLFSLLRTSSISSKQPKMIIGSLGEFVLTANEMIVMDKAVDGKDVTDEVLDADGKFTRTGTYFVKFALAGYEIAYDGQIRVEEIFASRKDGKQEPAEIQLGQTWDFGEYEAYIVGVDGKPVKSEVAPTYYIGSTKLSSLEDAFDISNGKYVLKKDLSYVGKKFAVKFNNVQTALNQKQTLTAFEILITSNYEYTNFGTYYVGTSINDSAKITVNGVEYFIVYKNNKLVAVAEDGEEKAIELTFNWNSKEGAAVEFDSNGMVTAYPVRTEAKDPGTNLFVSLNVDGYFFNGTVSAKQVYASNSKYYKVNNTKLSLYGLSGDYEFKFGASGYAIYKKGTDEVAFEVDITVKTGGSGTTSTDSYTQDYELSANGTFADVGDYVVFYSMTINGVLQEFWQFITVKA